MQLKLLKPSIVIRIIDILFLWVTAASVSLIDVKARSDITLYILFI